MQTDLVEVTEHLSCPPERAWAVLGEPELYPRFVREITSVTRVGEIATGQGARYQIRLLDGPDRVRLDEFEIVAYRAGKYLVVASRHRPEYQSSIAVRPGAEGTEVRIRVALRPGGPSESTIRRAISQATVLVRDHLSGIAPVPEHGDIAQVSVPMSRAIMAKTLTRIGVFNPGRPDRDLRALAEFAKWGATFVGGYRAAAVRAPRDLAAVDERRGVTFKELDRRTNALAHSLAELGVTEDRKVAVMCRNHVGLLESIVACGKLGADVLLLNTGLSPEQVTDLLRAEQPALALADDEFLPMLRRGGLPIISTWPEQPGGRTLDSLVENGSVSGLSRPSDPGRVIVLTSGTTGTPKGARRPTPRGLGSAVPVFSRIPLQAGDRMLIAAPVFHSWGLAAAQLAMPIRAGLVLHRRFDAEATLAAIEAHRVTALIAVPVMLQRMLALPPEVRERYDTSSLRIVASSGSALPAGLVTGFMDAFGDVLYNLYGSTEVSWASIADPADLRAAPSTAGRCPAGTRVGVLDETGHPVPPGVVGEIAVANDMLFDGYTNGMTNSMHGPLMRTGDGGYFDADGRLFVVGRIDDMIISGGENVYPGPLEDLLNSMPGVQEAAVMPVSDPEFGQRFAAYVMRLPGVALDADAVRSFVHHRLPRFSVPRDVVFVRWLPRNATGKVVKRMLDHSRFEFSGPTTP